MPSLPQLPNFNIKVIFLVHFVFISLSCIGHWTPPAYLLYNVILIFLLITSVILEQSHEPIQLAIVVNGISVILDVLVLVFCFPDQHGSAASHFSAAMSILHLLARPGCTWVMIKNLEERSGASGSLTGLFSKGRNESYEDMDRNTQPQTSGQSGGYDFSSAQQI